MCEKLIEVAGFPRIHDTMNALSACRRARKGCFIMGATTWSSPPAKRKCRGHEIGRRAANNSHPWLETTFVNAVKFVARSVDFTAFLAIRGVRRDKYAGMRLVVSVRFLCSSLFLSLFLPFSREIRLFL